MHVMWQHAKRVFYSIAFSRQYRLVTNLHGHLKQKVSNRKEDTKTILSSVAQAAGILGEKVS